MQMLETERLILRTFSEDDAPFYMELVNDPVWIRFIGQRNLHNLTDTRVAIVKGPIAMFARHGFCLFVAERKRDSIATGICGLIKRDQLDDVDLGFAFLPAFRGQGYALEAASATMDYAKNTVGLKRIVGLTNPDNLSSIKLLEKMGFVFEKLISLGVEKIDTKLFVYEFA